MKKIIYENRYERMNDMHFIYLFYYNVAGGKLKTHLLRLGQRYTYKYKRI